MLSDEELKFARHYSRLAHDDSEDIPTETREIMETVDALLTAHQSQAEEIKRLRGVLRELTGIKVCLGSDNPVSEATRVLSECGRVADEARAALEQSR